VCTARVSKAGLAFVWLLSSETGPATESRSGNAGSRCLPGTPAEERRMPAAGKRLLAGRASLSSSDQACFLRRWLRACSAMFISALAAL
jgi:hypothetical protein